MRDTELPAFAVALRRGRLAAGLTQEELAERARLSRRGVSALERGVRRAPHTHTVEALADALTLGEQQRRAFTRAARRRPTELAQLVPDNLPMLPTSLIGRDDELERTTELLLSRGTRLLTLCGPAGVGKTALALQLASELRDEFVDGVFFVALSPLTDPAFVPAAAAASAGVRDQSDRPLTELLCRQLRDSRILLILDNGEHLIDAVGALTAELLTSCRQVRVLVTSRQPVRIRAEQLVRVDPLPVPPAVAASATAVPTDAASAASVRLFLDRAAAVDPDFRLTTGNARPIAEICRRLDGLPLALELAASRVVLLTPAALLDRLERRLDVLVDGPRDLPERQRTLRAALDWSYDLLSPPEQVLFRRLSVFHGGWTPEAAAALVPDLEVDVLHTLASLVSRNLCRRQDEVPGTEPRAWMLHTIREYARDRLEASGERACAERAHAAYYAELAAPAIEALTTSEQQTWVARLNAEHDNIRTALAFALKHADAELGLRITGAVGRFWSVHGCLREGRAWLEALLALDTSGVPDAVVSRALSATGNLALRQGDVDRAEELQQQALSLRRQTGDVRGTGSSLCNLGNIALSRGDLSAAESYYEQGRAVLRECGDAWGAATAVDALGRLLRRLGDLAGARVRHEEALALFRQLGDAWGVASVLDNLADVALDEGDLDRTRALLKESLTGFRELEDRLVEAQLLEKLADIATRQGQADRAARLLGAGATIRGELGSPPRPSERAAYDDVITATRAALGAAAFDAAWQHGASLPIGDAVGLALEPERPEP